MASVTVRGCALCVVSLLNLMFVFISGADLVRFLSFRAIYHNITGETKICQGKLDSLTPVAQICNGLYRQFNSLVRYVFNVVFLFKLAF